MAKRGLARTYEYRDKLWLKIQELEENPEKNKLMLGVLNANLESEEATIRCVEEGKPLLASWYGNAPEIYTAMGIHWYCVVQDIAHHVATGLNDLEECDKMAIPKDICTLLRLGAYAVEAGLVPTPTAAIAMMTPCDGLSVFHDVIRNNKEWRNVPFYGINPDYWNDEKSMDYCAGELKRMVSFIEKHTGCKLDIDRLREVVEESNKQYELWSEYNELRRAVPCPGGSFEGLIARGIAHTASCADPRGTSVLKDLVAGAEGRFREKKGWIQNERIRIFWLDNRPVWGNELARWLEKEWGANVVMDGFSYCPYTTTDISSEESMFKGLAKRAMDTPMLRQGRGMVGTLLDDIVRIVKDYKIDCVVFPGHMGHKDQSASVGLMRETCRDLNVPFLQLETDLYDPRYTPIDTVKNQMSQFFTAMGLGWGPNDNSP